MTPSITPSQGRRLTAGLTAQIRRYERCRQQLLQRVDREVSRARMSCFGSAKGRRLLIVALRRIDHGVYL